MNNLPTSFAIMLNTSLLLHKTNPKRRDMIKLGALLCKITDMQVLFVPFISFTLYDVTTGTWSIGKNNLISRVDNDTSRKILKRYLKLIKEVEVTEDDPNIEIY